MKLNKPAVALFGIALLVGCGGSGGGGNPSPDAGTPITIHISSNDAIVAFQDGDGEWVKLVPSAGNDCTARVKDPTGRYGVAVSRVGDHAIRIYQLTIADGTVVPEKPESMTNDLTGTDLVTVNVDVLSPSGVEARAAMDNGATTFQDETGLHQIRVRAGGDLVGFIEQRNILDHTDRALTFGQINVLHGLTAGTSPTITLKRDDAAMSPMAVFNTPNSWLASATYITPHLRAYAPLPIRRGASTSSYLAPAAEHVTAGDRIVVIQQSSSSLSSRKLFWALPGGMDLPASPAFPPEAVVTSAIHLSTDAGRTVISFEAPTTTTSIRLQTYARNRFEEIYLSPTWLGRTGISSYTTPPLRALSAFPWLDSSPDTNVDLDVCYTGTGFLKSLSSHYAAELSEPNLPQYGSNVKAAVASLWNVVVTD